MKIYTKTGDKGLTSLIGGTRVRKDNARVEAYGTVDELNSWLGLLRDVSHISTEQSFLTKIQNELFVLGSHLASDPLKDGIKLPSLNQEMTLSLELEIDRMDAGLPVLKNFILPGGHINVSYCQIARSVCRRAERSVSALEGDEVTLAAIVFLNRLSDYLFTLCRFWSMSLGAEEIAWIPSKRQE